MSEIKEWVLASAVILLFFGEGLPFPWLQGGIMLLALAALVDQLSTNHSRRWRIPGMPALGGWLVLALWQLLPLPPGVLKVLAPGAWRLYRDTVWILTPGVWMPLGPIPDRTLQGAFYIGLLAVLYWLLAYQGSDRDNLLRLLRRVCWGGAVYATGLAVWWGWPQKAGAGVFAQWLGRPHALLPVAVLLPLATVLYLYSRPRRVYGSPVERMRTLFRQPGRHGHVFLLAIVVVLGLLTILGAPVLMQIALVIGLLITAGFLLARSACRRGWFLPVLMALVLALGAGLKKQQPHFSDAELPSYEASLWVDHPSLGRDFLLFGAGAGNFADLERRYGVPSERPSVQGAPKPGRIFLNAWGLAGTLLLLCFWLAVCGAAASGWLRRRNRLSLYLFAGTFGALAIDFVIRGVMPAGGGFVPGAQSFFLAGMLVAAGCFHYSGEADPCLETLSFSGRRLLLPVLAGFLGLGLIYYGGKVSVRQALRRPFGAVAQETSRELSDEQRAWLRRALWLDSLEGRYPFALGEDLQARQETDRALPYLARGVRLNPLDGPSVYRLGQVLGGLGRPETGKRLMTAGLLHAPLAADLHRDYVLRLLTGEDSARLYKTLRRLLILAPEQTRFWLRYLEKRHLDQAQWAALLPRQSGVYLQYGDYRLARGDMQAATRAFQEAVRLAATEQAVDTGLFLHVAKYFEGQGRLEEALGVVRSGMQTLPRDITLLLTAGSLYERLGITYRASELYRKALLLDPEHGETRERLGRLGEL